MGGLPCLVVRNATLLFPGIPTNPKDLAAFDSQMRVLYSDLSQDVVNDAPDKAMQACEILAKQIWTDSDRLYLYNLIESLYPEYTSAT